MTVDPFDERRWKKQGEICVTLIALSVLGAIGWILWQVYALPALLDWASKLESFAAHH